MRADENPKAAYHLKLAKDQISTAENLMDGDDEDRLNARRLLERAEADAELAIAYARTSDVRTEAQRAWSEVDELRKTAE